MACPPEAMSTSREYKRVTVFCSGGVCRNNLGNWKTVFVSTNRKRFDFEHYAQKDAQMAAEADHGLFLWNGKSRALQVNPYDYLVRHGKMRPRA